jgi:Nucleotide-diphospho-sugar transferase
MAVRKRPQILCWSNVGLSLVLITVTLSLGLRKSSLSLRNLNHYQYTNMKKDPADIALSIEKVTVTSSTDVHAPAAAHSVPVGQTKIIAACDYVYKDMALAWYESLTKLGYTTHMVLAVDEKTADFFRQRGLRHDILLPPLMTDDDDDKDGGATSANFCYQEHKKQWYRRVIFGMRWHYVLGQLEQGYHVLMTDLDNIFVRHHALSNMEEWSDFDVFHTYAKPYPADVYAKLGYTVCGCLTWLRSSTGSLNFVKALLNRCQQHGRSSNGMKCYACDDQVEVNKLYMGYKSSSSMTLDVPDDFGQQGFWKSSIGGRVNSTNHTFYIWDSDLAYRGPILGIEGRCPGQSNSTHTARSPNWMAAPTTSASTKKGLDGAQERRARMEEWSETCGKNNTSTDSFRLAQRERYSRQNN